MPLLGLIATKDIGSLQWTAADAETATSPFSALPRMSAARAAVVARTREPPHRVQVTDRTMDSSRESRAVTESETRCRLVWQVEHQGRPPRGWWASRGTYVLDVPVTRSDQAQGVVGCRGRRGGFLQKFVVLRIGHERLVSSVHFVPPCGYSS